MWIQSRSSNKNKKSFTINPFAPFFNNQKDPFQSSFHFFRGGVDEKDVIIMTQMRQINDLEKSLKVVEKILQLVTGFTCVII